MTNEEIYELAEEHGDWDDFGRWTFRDNDRLLAFVDAILKVERETCAVLIESTPTMLGSPKRDNLSWVGLATGEAMGFYESDLSREELIHKIDEFLQEKNT
jgi:hypothetical protein